MRRDHVGPLPKGRLMTGQQGVLLGAVVLVILAALWAPWEGTVVIPGKSEMSIRRFAGYHWVFLPPIPADFQTFDETFGDIESDASLGQPWRYRETIRWDIDEGRLLLEWLLIVLASVGLILAVHKARNA